MVRQLTFWMVLGGSVLCAAAQKNVEVEDYYAPANLLRFADHLFATGDYLRAAGEYRRYLFFSPANAEQVLYRMAQCYQLAGEVEQALPIFAHLIRTSADKQLVGDVHFEIGRSFFLMGFHGKSLKYIEDALAQTVNLEGQWQLHQLKGLNYLKQRRWVEAEQLFRALSTKGIDGQRREQARLFERYALEGQGLPRKNPVFAGALSTVVPGLGKVYVDRTYDGIFSFLTIGFMGWLTYDGFQDDGRRSLKGWIFAPLVGVFHLGNIYGSVLTAHFYNRDAETDFISRIPFDTALSARRGQ